MSEENKRREYKSYVFGKEDYAVLNPDDDDTVRRIRVNAWRDQFADYIPGLPVAVQCNGYGRYAVRCKRRTCDASGFCKAHREQALLFNKIREVERRNGAQKDKLRAIKCEKKERK